MPSVNTDIVTSSVALRPERPAGVSTTPRRGLLGRVLLEHNALVVVSLIFVCPILWMALTSLKPVPEAVTFPPVWLPHPWVWGNYPAR